MSAREISIQKALGKLVSLRELAQFTAKLLLAERRRHGTRAAAGR